MNAGMEKGPPRSMPDPAFVYFDVLSRPLKCAREWLEAARMPYLEIDRPPVIC